MYEFDITWPYLDPTTHHPRLAVPSNDFFTDRNYQGTRYNPLGLHFGIDVPVPLGTLLVAPFTCAVTFAGKYGDLGVLLRLTDAWGREWGFAHNQFIGGSVHVGGRYSKGYPLARTDTTGRATGPHSHVFRTIRPIGSGAWGSQPYENPRPELVAAYRAAGGR